MSRLVKTLSAAFLGAAVLLMSLLSTTYAQANNHPLAHVRHAELQLAATTLGLADVKALRKELAGSTLTAVAQKHNVAPSTVSAAITADLNSRIQAAASAGTIKSARATRLTQKVPARVDKLMAHQFPTARTT